MKIKRYLAAPERSKLSNPILSLIKRRILTKDRSHLDYGCGKGRDVFELQRLGYKSIGYDPYYFPAASIVESDIVTLSFVLNVIEIPSERIDVLVRCWGLTRLHLCVGVARAIVLRGQPFGDGLVSSIGTFQKKISQAELLEMFSFCGFPFPKKIGRGIFLLSKNS